MIAFHPNMMGITKRYILNYDDDHIEGSMILLTFLVRCNGKRFEGRCSPSTLFGRSGSVNAMNGRVDAL